MSTLANQCLCMRFSVISGQPVFPAFSPRARKSSFLRCYRHQKLLFPRDKQAHQPTSSQRPLLHPPYTLPLNTRPPSHGHTPYPPVTHRGRRALLSTTLSLRRATSNNNTFQMTLTVVVGPAAGRNCGLAAPPLLEQPGTEPGRPAPRPLPTRVPG